MSHSRVSPSSAGQWVHCTGMIELIKGLENPSSDSAMEGDAAHWLASHLINGRSEDMHGVLAPNGHIIDSDMINYITQYADDVRQTVGNKRILIHVEEAVKIPKVHAEAFGTPDCWFYDSATDTLYIWDLKFGWGLVDVFENWQMLMYAIGISRGSNIVMRLVQPRPYHEDGPIREWCIDKSILATYENRLFVAAHEAMSGNGKLCSGPHCKHCLARSTCPADRHASMNAIDVAGFPVGHDVLNYDYELDILERAKEVVNQRYDALVEHVTTLIKKGTPVPGRGIVSVPGRGATWTKPVEEIITLGNIFHVNLQKPVSVLTPTQSIKAGIPKEIIDGYAQRRPSGLKLVKDDQRKVKELLS